MVKPTPERINQLVTEGGFTLDSATRYATDEANLTGLFTPAKQQITQPNVTIDTLKQSVENTPKDIAALVASPSAVDTKTAEVQLNVDAKKAAMTGEYHTIDQFDRLNPQATAGERLRAQAKIMRSNHKADRSRSTGDVISDVVGSAAQRAISNTAGLVTGLGVAATAPNLPATKQEVSRQQAEADVYAATGGNLPATLTNIDPFFGQVVEEVGAERPEALLGDYADEAVAASKAVSDYSNEVKEFYSSDQRKAQEQRYAEAKSAFESTPEYQALEKEDKVLADIKFTAEALYDNPLLIEDIGVQGLADLGTSILVAGGAAKLVKANLKDKLPSKRVEDKLATKAAATTAGVQGVLAEASSAANEAVSRVLAMNHDELMKEDSAYEKLYSEAVGSHEEKEKTAKNALAADAAKNTFIGTGLLTAGINKVTGVNTAIGNVATGKMAGLKKRAKAVAGETIEETTQSGGSSVITNVALTTANEDQDLVEGTGENIVKGAVGGSLASSGIQAASTVTPAINTTADVTAKVVKGTYKTAKAIYTAPAKFRANREARKAAKEAEASNDTVEPVVAATEPVIASTESILKVTEPSESVKGVQAEAKVLNESATQMREAIKDIEANESTLAAFLSFASQAQDQVISLREKTIAAMDGATPEDKAHLEGLADSLVNTSDDSFMNAIGVEISKKPELQAAMTTAFIATVTNDTEELEAVLGNFSEQGISDEVAAKVKASLLTSALYSMDFMDDSVSLEHVQSAAKQSTGETKKQYEAIATIKDIDSVAQEVTDGEGEFVGINTHLRNIKKQISEGKSAATSIKQVEAFAKQRTAKAEALEKGIADAEGIVFNKENAIKVTWGSGSSHTISSKKSLEATKALANQVRVEEALVQSAVIAANRLEGKDVETSKTDESEAPVVDEPTTTETVSETTEPSPEEELDFNDGERAVIAEAPVVDEEAKQAAITKVTEGYDLELSELIASRDLRKDIISKQEKLAERTNTPSAYKTLDDDKAILASTERQIDAVTKRRDRAVAKAERQYDLEQLDWTIGFDATSGETPTKQASNLIRDVFTVITGTDSIKAIEAEYAVDTSSQVAIRSFLKDKTNSELIEILDFVSELSLNKDDAIRYNRLIGTSKAIITAPTALKDTLASLVDEPESKFDLQQDNVNRFKGATSYRESKLWQDTNYLNELIKLTGLNKEEVKTALIELGLDTSKLNENDYNMLNLLAEKKVWFDTEMSKLNATLNKELTGNSQSMYDQNKLRFLLDADGNFPTKIVDAAFMAYMNATASVTTSVYNDDSTIMSILGLTDSAQLDDVPEYGRLRITGSPVSKKDVGTAFKQAMALGHDSSLPLSVTDGVYSAMGGMLFNIMSTTDSDFLVVDTLVKGHGLVTGLTLRTEESTATVNRVHSKKETPMLEGENFTAQNNAGKGLLAQISEPVNNEPSNYVGIKPPKVTASETHIRSTDRLTPAEVEAENIYRAVEHEVDNTVTSLHTAIGLEGFKELKGYVEDTDELNSEHKLTIDGKNQEIEDSYIKVDTLLKELDESESKTIYFSNAFSSVRRQQQRGAVTPQGNKYHRIVIGHSNKGVIESLDLKHMSDALTNKDNYFFLLGLAQAYGYDVDKQYNDISVLAMVKELSEIVKQEATGEGVYAELGNIMDKDGNIVDGGFTKSLLKALKEEANGDAKRRAEGKALTNEPISDHKLQGIMTVARMLRQAKDGKVTGFNHYIRAEIDGLTNGPAHATFMSGLGGLSKEQQEATLKRFGYLVGNGTDNNTHSQIGVNRIVDSYKTVARVANTFLEEQLRKVKEALTGDTEDMAQADAKVLDAAYAFLKGKGLSIKQEGQSLAITRNGTKNPVTVTVYGGGAEGIHKKMASELRDTFAEELSQMIKDIKAGKLKKTALVAELRQWENVFSISSFGEMSLISKVVKANTYGSIIKELQDFKFDKDFKTTTVYAIKELYGNAITDAIDDVFSENKRNAALMNVTMNFITGMANDTFAKSYIALHEKRVAEGAIRKYDTLSSKDVGLLQRKIEEAMPFLKTALSDETSIAKSGTERLAKVGVEEARFPTTANKGSTVVVNHSTKSMALPGVRAIPVLTISIDGAVQVKNHLIQGKLGNFLNVLDAIDRVANKSLRASNELFNVAEYMGIMETDMLANVRTALIKALNSQLNPIEVEGIEITPTLTAADIEDTSGILTEGQEAFRQSLQDMALPIAKGIEVSVRDVGDLQSFMAYLLKQLEVEQVNNQVARDEFIFGNGRVAINQMAGIDNGHADIVNGKVVLSEEARALLDDAAVQFIDNFNRRMDKRYRDYKENPLVPKQDSSLEVLNKKVQDSFGEVRSENARLIKDRLLPLSGLWHDMRGTFNLDTGTSIYKVSGENLNKFKEILSPSIKFKTLDNFKNSNASVHSPIPTVGSLLNNIIGKNTKSGDYLDNLLNNLEIHFTSDLPKGVNGSYETIAKGKKRIRTIKIRQGLTTEQANIVLAHEIIHAITQGGIAYGVANPKSREGIFVRDLWKQMGRTIAYMKKQTTPPASFKTIELLYKATLSKNTDLIESESFQKTIKQLKAKNLNKALEDKVKGELLAELALNEFIAIIGSESVMVAPSHDGKNQYKGFLNTTVKKDLLSPQLRKAVEFAWNTVRNYLTKTFGRVASVKTHVTIRNKLNKTHAQEQDVLASILAGLGKNSMTVTNQSLDSTESTAFEDTTNIVRAVESKADDFLRKGANLTIEAVLRSMGKVLDNTGLTGYADASPEQRELALTEAINTVLTQSDDITKNNKPMSAIRSTFTEFLPRDSERSQVLDKANDVSKHSIDNGREVTKTVISESILEKLPDLTDNQNKAITKLVIRGDLFSLGSDVRRLRSLLENPERVSTAMADTVNAINNLADVSTRQKNLMINEALSLGARSITGGAYEGFNLPNAKAIVRMVGVNLPAVVDSDGSIEKLVDNLATLSGINATSIGEREILSGLLSNRPDGVKHVADQHNTVKERIIEQYGEGKRLTLPKGYINEQANPNRAIKVVAWRDRSKYKGYEFVREFHRDDSDANSDKRMALLVSKEGGAVHYVQGAMSTIEAAVGGFTTKYGSALDKSLPAITSGFARTTAKNKAKSTNKFSSGIRQPVPLKEGLIPNINSMGEVIGYRYAIDNAEREKHLETTDDVAELVSTYAARITEQQVSEQFNNELMLKLKEAYDKATPTEQLSEFVRVSSGSTDPKILEIWRVIPQHTKVKAKEIFGGNFVYVHKRDLDNALGYREWSISKLWNNPTENKAMFVDTIEALMGDNAVNYLRYAERVLQELVVSAKDLIVIKSIVVPVANIISNMVHLSLRGVDPVTIVKEAKLAREALGQWKADHKALIRAENLQEVSGEDLSEVIEPLKESLANNPVAFMIEEGLLPSVIEETESTTRRGSVKQGIIDGLMPKVVNERGNTLIDAGKWITLSQGSSSYQFFADMLEAGDFAAKFILYNELKNNEGKTHDEAMSEVRTEFINYNTLSNDKLDYLNKTGGVFFFKYFSRIQPIIMNSIKRNPTRTFTTWIGADTVGIASAFDAALITKDVSATSGAFDLLNMAGGAHPLTNL